MLGHLTEMDISKLTDLADVSSSISEAMKQSSKFERKWLEALKPAFEHYSRLDELSKLSSLSQFENQFGVASRMAKEMVEQSRHLASFIEPISQLRESILLSDQVSKAMASSNLAWNNAARELAESLSATSSAMRMSAEISKQMADISSLHLDRFAELTKPYKGLLDSMAIDSYAVKAAREIGAQHNWAKQFQLPIIDSAAAAAIAAVWGREGVEKQLKSFGVEYQQMLDGIASPQEPGQGASKIRVPPVDFWTGVSILLAILMFIYQLRDSAQMEDRLTSEIRLSRDAAKDESQIIEQLLKALIESKQPNESGEIQFVVRSRVATVRTSPSAGTAVVAKIFPNQVVTLLDENGKWIEVSYFDWLNQEVRTGWVLKKYLVRVPTGRLDPQHEVGDE